MEPHQVTPIPVVNAVIRAVASKNIDEFLPLLAPELRPCSTRNEELFIGPQCKEGEAEGSLVPTILRASCSGARLRVDSAKGAVSDLISKGFAIEAVYKPAREDAESYLVVFHRIAPDSSFPTRIGIMVNALGITGYTIGCPTEPFLHGENGATIVYRAP